MLLSVAGLLFTGQTQAIQLTKLQRWQFLIWSHYYLSSSINRPLVKLDLRTLKDLLSYFFFHFQNPGFDFSSAKLDKRYEDKYISQAPVL
jgi:hypothetical protein